MSLLNDFFRIIDIEEEDDSREIFLNFPSNDVLPSETLSLTHPRGGSMTDHFDSTAFRNQQQREFFTRENLDFLDPDFLERFANIRDADDRRVRIDNLDGDRRQQRTGFGLPDVLDPLDDMNMTPNPFMDNDLNLDTNSTNPRNNSEFSPNTLENLNIDNRTAALIFVSI